MNKPPYRREPSLEHPDYFPPVKPLLKWREEYEEEQLLEEQYQMAMQSQEDIKND